MWILVWLLFAHWVADFVFQRHVWAMNKSKSVLALSKHVGVYTLAMTAATWVVGSPWPGLVVGLLHWPVDFVTSKVTSKLYADEEYHNFFVVVGLDQWIHLTTIVILGWSLT